MQNPAKSIERLQAEVADFAASERTHDRYISDRLYQSLGNLSTLPVILAREPQALSALQSHIQQASEFGLEKIA